MQDRYSINQDGISGNCLHTTRIALSVCEHYGVTSSPMFGVFMAFNKIGWRCFKNHTPSDKWPPAAWSVGVELEDATTNTIGGHAFLVAKQGNEDYLIDLSANQAHRPERGINLTPVVLPISEAIAIINWEGVGETHVWRIDKTYVAYSGGTDKWTPPWEWVTVPNGYLLERNQKEINDMIADIDDKLQLSERTG